MNRGFLLFLVSLLFVFFSSCGYRVGEERLHCEKVFIPYVDGDRDGRLTAAIVRRLNFEGCYAPSVSEASSILKISLIDFNDENIGFRYDRKEEGGRDKNLIPTETRLSAIVEVTLLRNGSCAVIAGPVRLSASVEFDHDYYSTRNRVNVFSLGQLTDEDDASDAASTPLNENLALKIVNFLSDGW